MDRTLPSKQKTVDADLLPLVLNAVPDNIALIDGNGLICYINSAWLKFGRENSAAEDKITVGSNYFSVCERACDNGGEDAFYAKKALSGIKSVINDSVHGFTLDYPCHSDDQQRWFTLRANPLKIDKDIYCLTSHANISDLKIAQNSLDAALQEAHAANAAKSTFLAAMSHELRTPLNSVLGFSGMMNEEVLGPIGNSQYREYLRLIHYSGERLLGLVDDILDLTRIERGETTFHDEDLDVRSELENFLKYYTPGLINSPQSQVTIVVAPDAPRLRADVRAFSQIVENLVSNALKFSGKNADVTITWAQTENGGGRLQISDNGPGILEIHQDKITEPFVKISHPQSSDPYVADKKSGVGLGLHIVSRIVNAHQAKLSVQSVPEEGATISIDFPPERTIPTRSN